MSKYLYGASVQGIQEFIFKTNTLKEIVGASELVKQISIKFEAYNADEVLVNAAGNIKAIFNSHEACQKVVLAFAKEIEQFAYGITLSQAVVSFENKYTQKDMDKLIKSLKIQRNKPSLPLDMSINLMKLNPSTAKPLVNKDNDRATQQKLDAFKTIEQNPDFKDLKNLSNSKNKLAVIHIDGNALGNIVKELTSSELTLFSKNLQIATQEAFDIAKKGKEVRDIILGGDDVTLICNANDALSFTKEFLENFQEQTKKKLAQKITACAGIAYSNEKYPFHYGAALADALCSEAKKHSKRESSCLMFHKIQSSNFVTWDKFVKDELTIKNDKDTIRLDFGAYYLSNTKEALIDKLIIAIESYRCDGSPISRLRNWLSELYKSKKYSNDLLNRINDVTAQSGKWNQCIMDKNLKNIDQDLSSEKLLVKKDGYIKTPIYDILQILSVTEAK